MESAERHLRRSQAMFFLDQLSFGVGITFLSPGALLPSLIRLLGGSPVAVGALSAIGTGGWLLPQLLVGRFVNHQTRVKGLVVGWALVSRLSIALLVPALLVFALRAPALAVTAVLLAWGGFNVADAVCSVGWFELLAKVVPVQLRGRLFGWSLALSSLLGVGVGAIAERVLAQPNPFPNAYILLVGLGAVFLSACIAAIAVVDEPPGDKQSVEQIPWRSYVPNLLGIWRRDPRFRWLAVTRWLAALADMAGAFYVLYALERFRLPASVMGLFIGADVIGSLASGPLGALGDRKGCRAVIKVVMALKLACPALALLTPLVAGQQSWAVMASFAAIFAIQGAIGSAFMVGFMNYMLEIAPPGERSIYVGLSNTLGGLVVLAPMAAGWLLQVTSYEAVFGLTLALALAGWLFAQRVPAGEHNPLATTDGVP